MTTTPDARSACTTAADVAHDRLLGIAAETFAELGWRDSTVVALCERADVPASDFYRWYESLDSFFVELYRAHSARVLSEARAAFASVTSEGQVVDPSEAVGAMAKALATTAADRTWWILTTEYTLRAVRHPSVAASYREARQEAHRAMTGAVADALRSAGLGDVVDPKQLVDLTTALHRGVVAHSFVEPSSVRPEDLDRVAWLALLKSLST